jgi:hypothetical protein
MPVGEILAGVWAAVWLYMEVNKLSDSSTLESSLEEIKDL